MSKLQELYESPGNWPEDFGHENGFYSNTCTYCKRVFFGHKRRVVCRLCAMPSEPPALMFRSEVNGAWYEDRAAAGDVDCVRIGERQYYLPAKHINDKEAGAAVTMMAERIQAAEATPTGKLMWWAARAAALLRAMSEVGSEDDRSRIKNTPTELFNAIEEVVKLDPMKEVLDMLSEYSLSYTDEKLAQLAASEGNSGEIGPYSAQREINRRAIVRKHLNDR